MDWDGKTPIPYLARSWTISPTARPTPSSCATTSVLQRQEIHRRRRGLFLQAPEEPRNQAPLAWRAGDIKELRAPDPYTVEYELATEPFSDLLLQLTMFTNVIHNKGKRRGAGQDYGVKGADGTGPWCFDPGSRAPRSS